MDEAASVLRIEIDSKPTAIDRLQRRLRQLDIERMALKKEKDKESNARLSELEKEYAGIKEEFDRLQLHWSAEKEVIDKIKKLGTKVGELKTEAEVAERNYNLQRVAEINYGELPEVEKQIEKHKEELERVQEKHKILKEEVTEEDVAEVVSRWTGIPVSKMLEAESRKLLRMESALAERVVGQAAAIGAVSNAVRRSRAGISDESRPIGSFIFLGPTGVGKTELAKSLAEFLFNDEKMMTRLDMSEYMEKHSVARLIGAPPGYIGHDEGGQLTEAVRRQPFSVILLDEIEKAHPDVFNALLQVLDDGRLTDSKGRVVDFKNTVVIMTSNLAAAEIAEFASNTGKQREEVLNVLKRHFRPEFLNRVDETIIFQHLGEEQIEKIVRIQLKMLDGRLNRQRIRFECSEEVVQYLAKKGYDRDFGARPLKRLLQNEIMDELSLLIIEGKIQKDSSVKAVLNQGVIEFNF
jgi:ATP-dependent Clp protease ATP-binding subunit ClpB